MLLSCKRKAELQQKCFVSCENLCRVHCPLICVCKWANTLTPLYTCGEDSTGTEAARLYITKCRRDFQSSSSWVFWYKHLPSTKESSRLWLNINCEKIYLHFTLGVFWTLRRTEILILTLINMDIHTECVSTSFQTENDYVWLLQVFQFSSCSFFVYFFSVIFPVTPLSHLRVSNCGNKWQTRDIWVNLMRLFSGRQTQ